MKYPEELKGRVRVPQSSNRIFVDGLEVAKIVRRGHSLTPLPIDWLVLFKGEREPRSFSTLTAALRVLVAEKA